LVDEPTASLDPKTSRQVMRLLVELADEHGLAAVINIHDVALAKQFVERIVGLRDGVVVFDGTPEELTEDVLTDIYGEEDWSLRARKGAEADHDGDDAAEGDDEPALATAGGNARPRTVEAP
jgi:phosphonate transport system ATP-binding protein